MRILRFAVIAVTAFAAGNAYAFHDGGVAACDGCHVMHNASNGQAKAVTGKDAVTIGVAGQPARSDKVNPFLLQGTDQSSTCLNCHSGTGAPFRIADFAAAPGVAPGNYTPGGDFGYLIKSFSWTAPFPGALASSPGQRHGHSIIAKDFGLTTVDNQHAPGGAFMSGTGLASLACTNCHDPHGRYRLQGSATNPVIRGPSALGQAINPIVASGSYDISTLPVGFNWATQAVGVYRLLGGKGYRPYSNPGFPFSADPPVAVAPDTYNSAEGVNEVRVAYGSGMSEWCANCHTYIHLDNYATGGDGLVHPAGNGGKLRQVQADIYNHYLSSGDLTGANAYTSLVPFESQVTDLAQLGTAANAPSATGSAGAGVFVAVANTSNVMCLSCHRAHASAWDNGLRWNMQTTFASLSEFPGTNAVDATAADAEYAQGRTQAETQAGYYGRTVGAAAGQIRPFNRSLCNKCHAKD